MKALLLLLSLALQSCYSDKTQQESHSDSVLNQLNSIYLQWEKTPYLLGGMSTKGVDCSGFVYKVIQQGFGIELPRTTSEQSQLPYGVVRSKMTSGDLVFFKIKEKNNLLHVGIYLENNKFMHASTSEGVVISDLKNNYWRDNYWKSIRVIY